MFVSDSAGIWFALWFGTPRRAATGDPWAWPRASHRITPPAICTAGSEAAPTTKQRSDTREKTQETPHLMRALRRLWTTPTSHPHAIPPPPHHPPPLLSCYWASRLSEAQPCRLLHVCLVSPVSLVESRLPTTAHDTSHGRSVADLGFRSASAAPPRARRP